MTEEKFNQIINDTLDEIKETLWLNQKSIVEILMYSITLNKVVIDLD